MKFVKTLPDLLEKLPPESKKYALIFEEIKISYSELNQKVNKFAQALINLGIKENDKVGILLRNCPEYVISIFGILKAGAIVVPLNFMLKEEELKPILEDAGVRFIISRKEFYPLLERLRLRIGSFEKIILIDASSEKSNFYFLIEEVKKIEEFPELNPQNIAVLIYTSGTTGKPKGVMLSHRNFISNIESCVQAINISKNELLVCILPLFHSFALTICLFLPLYTGGTVLLFSTIKPLGKVIKAILKYRVTIFIGIPQIYKVLSEYKIPWFLKLPFVQKIFLPLKICISGAAPLPWETLNRFQKKFKVSLLEGYGLTEASPVVSLNPLRKSKPGSVGLPLPGIKVKIIDKNGQELPSGAPGELIVRGENVMQGYYRQKEETGEVIKDGWLYTQDIAKRDDEGYIYILDRKKDLIIVRGLNVYPREIEEVIYQNPKVKETAVIGIQDESRGEVPKAFVVTKEGEQLKEKELLKFLRERIASYKVPRYIEFREELPKSSLGKILRRKLKEEN